MNLLPFRRLAIGLAALLCAVVATAGEFVPKLKSAVFVNGSAVVQPAASIVLEFDVAEYVYGSKEHAYMPLAVLPERLNYRQREGLSSWDIHGARANLPGQSVALVDGSKPYRMTFQAPAKPGRYRIVAGRMPFFSTQALASGGDYKQSFAAIGPDRVALIAQLAHPANIVYSLAVFEVSAAGAGAIKTPPLVYLRVNDRTPLNAELPGGLQPKAITMSWEVQNQFKGDRKSLRYRYQLEPEDDDWGAWTSATDVSYSFLLKGAHQFRVQARYDDGKTLLDSVPATFHFTLPKDHVSRPSAATLTKAPYGVPTSETAPIEFSKVYAKSRALVVGMWKFSDASHFPRFEEASIKADVAAISAALRRNGFEVTTLLREEVKREDVSQALTELVDAANKEDRLFVYFSTHGFPDKSLPTDVYLATADCEFDRPPVRCFRLADLQNHAERALAKQVKQVLFAVDSCFSGLGVVLKSVQAPNLNRLASAQGAFMLTAGMSSQLAQIDPTLGMSTFTHFLADGLNGNANLLGNDGLITLSELYVYVQYKVAEKTGAQQIPMLGRIKGDGEMLFRPAN